LLPCPGKFFELFGINPEFPFSLKKWLKLDDKQNFSHNFCKLASKNIKIVLLESDSKIYVRQFEMM
jgi:hypothetical protein